MTNIIKIALFVIVNIAGFFTISVLANVAVKIGLFPSLPPGIHTETFKMWFMAGGMWVFIGSVFISIGYFFTRDELKHWLLFAPMYCTGIYGTAVILYFNFIYSVV
ncbi:MAG: hypothetical protein VXW91_05700 [Pseudomonadota bacterium]|nr:hypothetical protein [Pseudomonadota bacterium]MEC8665334.1 hypothetical protein [Pseudomonadota bacterium]